MMLVFGGTTEGRLVSSVLAETGQPFWYSTKTKVDSMLPPNGKYRYGIFTPATLIAFCQEQTVTTIIHASHPFAALLHDTIDMVSKRLFIPVIRMERAYPEIAAHPLLRYAGSYEAVLAQLIREKLEPVLSLTGVQTISKWKPYWQHRKMYCRILPRDTSLAIAQQSGFPESQLILSFPGKTVEEEWQVIRETNVQAIVTKESGESGFLSIKAAAALKAGVPLYIIKRPALPAHFIKVHSREALLKQLSVCI